MYSVKLTIYIINTVYSVQYAMYITQYTVYSVSPTMYTIQCLHRTIFSEHCIALYTDVWCSVESRIGWLIEVDQWMRGEDRLGYVQCTQCTV